MYARVMTGVAVVRLCIAVVQLGMGLSAAIWSEKFVNPALQRRDPPEVRARRWKFIGYGFIAIATIQIIAVLA